MGPECPQNQRKKQTQEVPTSSPEHLEAPEPKGQTEQSDIPSLSTPFICGTKLPQGPVQEHKENLMQV